MTKSASRMKAPVLASILVLALAGHVQAQVDAPSWTPPDGPELEEGFPELRDSIEHRIARHRGVVGLVLLDSRSGESLSIRGGELFPSASVIKIPILYEVMLREKEDRLSLDDPLTMLSGDRVGGTGILQHLSAPFTLTVRDAAFLMISMSDNTATNLILEKVGARAVSDRMAELGLPESRVFRKVFGQAEESFDPSGSREWGLGVTTPVDQARLLAWIHREEAVSGDASREMLRMLDAQVYRSGLPWHLPGGIRIAHKTGSISEARHDCGIVYGAAREYVLCIMTRENEDTGWAADNEAERLIADLSGIVFKMLNP